MGVIVVRLGPVIGAVPLLGIVAILLIGYARSVAGQDRDATTLVAGRFTLGRCARGSRLAVNA